VQSLKRVKLRLSSDGFDPAHALMSGRSTMAGKSSAAVMPPKRQG
jgi:hypothetical protein